MLQPQSIRLYGLTMKNDQTPKLVLDSAVKPAAVRGRPWVYANQLQMNAEARRIVPGSVVRLAEPNGRLLGLYHFNPHSLIAARLLTRNTDRTIDAGYFEERLARALRLRDRLFEAPYYRLCHAEGDSLPGLVIDRHGDVLVVQPNTAGMTAALPDIRAALEALMAPRSIVVASDGPARASEGLEPLSALHGMALPVPLVIEENGCRFAIDPLGGQKTGWFYDHRDNRAFAARLSRGASVLDAYCYAGGFGLAAAKAGAARVTLVDRSAPALDLVRTAADLSGLNDCLETVTSEGFAYLEQETRRFDVVIADPPAFAKSRKDAPAALKGYEKLARLAADRVAEGGFLCLASCSHNVLPEAFAEATVQGLRAAGRAGRRIHAAGAGPDHPVHPFLPQTAYLKFIAYALD